jgi:hypothetical protein
VKDQHCTGSRLPFHPGARFAITRTGSPVDACREQIQNRPVTRGASSIIATVLALALVAGASTSSLRGTPWSAFMAHHATSAGESGAERGADGIRGQAPCTVPGLVAGPAIIVAPLRVVDPPPAAVTPAAHRPYQTSRRLLDASYSEHPHVQPHLHALPLLI